MQGTAEAPLDIPNYTAERDALDARSAEESGPVLSYTLADLDRQSIESRSETAVKMVVDDGLSQSAAARRTGIGVTTVNRALVSAIGRGEVEKTAHGQYRRPGEGRTVTEEVQALRKQVSVLSVQVWALNGKVERLLRDGRN